MDVQERGGYSAVTRRSNGEGDDEGDGEAQDEIGGGSECNAEDHDEGGCEDEGEVECLDEDSGCGISCFEVQTFVYLAESRPNIKPVEGGCIETT